MAKEIIGKIGVAATWAQLAEEATELAHAALKVERIIRAENPTPVSYDEAVESCIAEFTDLQIMADELSLKPSPRVAREKIERFRRRYNDFEKSNKNSRPRPAH